MGQPVPPADQPPASPPTSGAGGAGATFKRKIGPFPMWAWLAIGAAIIGLYVIWRRNQTAQASTSTADTSTSAADVPQFVNQTYVTTTPPTAPTPPTGPAPPVPPPNQPHPKPKRPTEITATGEDTGDINRIAQSYGLTEQQLIAANPGLRRIRVRVGRRSVPLIGSGAPVPRGTRLRIPAA